MMKPITTPTTITPKKLSAVGNVDYQQLSKHWFDDGDVFMTHFLNALSITFPDGERFFMNSVRNAIKGNSELKKKVDKDHSLRKDIRSFISQESLHGHEHDRLNNFLKEHGYPVDEAIKLVKFLLRTAEKSKVESLNLAVTCALEHITAILGDMIISDEQLLGKIDYAIRPLWLWHAQEEIEHKAVAFDVYELGYDKDKHYIERTASLVVATLFLLLGVHGIQAAFILKDGKFFDIKMWYDGFNKLYGAPRGHKPYIRRLVPAYMQYFEKNFHPHNNIHNKSIENVL